MDQIEKRRRWLRLHPRRFWPLFRRLAARAFSQERGGFEQPRLWLLAVLMGVLVGYGSVLFVLAIDLLNQIFFKGGIEEISDNARLLKTLTLISVPTAGGLIVGGLFSVIAQRAGPMTVADVIEARALSDGRFDWRRGFLTTIAAALSLGFGASAGREGPAVVAGASISGVVSRYVSLSSFERRTLLGCAVAAAVSASFNAPLAGALFALEVVLGHYAVRAFAPITIASVLGAMIGRSVLGDEPAFELTTVPPGEITEFPALFLLGLLSAIVAMVFMGAVQIARDVMDRAREAIRAPIWVQTGLAGLIVGCIAAAGAPEVLGVGYSATNAALAGGVGFWTCVMLVMVKIIASAITMGGRFAGGVFSPALMLGALTGCAFGVVATSLFSDYASSVAIYALAGMGAVSGAVLGAPISTTLIVFELSANYSVAIAVMISTSVATVATQQIFRKSFFHWQLARRGMDIISEPEHELLPGLTARAHMRVRGDEKGASETLAWELARQGVYLAPGDDFRAAFRLFRRKDARDRTFIPVMDPEKDLNDKDALLGALFYVDALSAYNRALVRLHREEHS